MKVYGNRLKTFEDIRRVYNFDKFVTNYRPKTADHGISKQFRLTFEVRKVDNVCRVFARSKQAIGAKTRWHEWVQMYPSLLDLRPRALHNPEEVPPVADNKLWPEFEEKSYRR